MNNKNHILLWLTFILSAIFISCKKTDTTVGSGLQEKEGVFSHFVLNDLDISTGTIIKNDSLYGSSSQYIYVGKYNDEKVGAVTAEAYVELGYGGSTPDFGINPVCDSVVVALGFTASTTSNRIIQGNGSAVNSLRVHVLEESFSTNRLASTSMQYSASPMQEANFTAATHGFNDAFLRLSTTSFGDDLLNAANNKPEDEFKNAIKGLAFTSNDNEEAIVGYNLESELSFVRVYYRSEDGNGQKGATQEYSFNISANLNHHTYINSDKSGSNSFANISNNLLDNSATNNQLLIQNGTGASIVLTIPEFIDRIDTNKDVIVNKATIQMPINPNYFEEQFNEAVPLIKIYEVDSLGNNNVVLPLKPDASEITGNDNYIFTYDEEEMRYELDLTYYFQEYVIGQRKLNSLLITPNISNNVLGVERSIINATDVSLNIFYSEI